MADSESQPQQQYSVFIGMFYQQFVHAVLLRLTASSSVTMRAFWGFMFPQWSILWYLLPVADSHTYVGSAGASVVAAGCTVWLVVRFALRIMVDASGVMKYCPSMLTTVPLDRHWLSIAESAVTNGV